MKKLISIRVNEMTIQQIGALRTALNMNQTEVISLAVDRLAQTKKGELKMATKFEITIGEDLDGFLGYDPTVIETVNIEASKSAYEKAVRKEINAVYPEINVEFAWGGQSNYSYLEYESEDYENIQEFLDEIEDRVYNRQDFWVYK